MLRKQGCTIDQVLEQIGSFELYQIRLLLILSYLQWFPIGFQILAMTFIAAEPNWRCVTNSTECTESGTFAPGHKYYAQRCNMNRSQWEFTTEFTSITTEFDLVCDKTFLASLSSSLIFGGWIISAVGGGYIADRFGRKTIMMLFCFTAGLFGFLSAFPTVYWLFALFRLLAGMSIGAGAMPIFVLTTEYVGVRHRHIAGNAICGFAWVAALLSLVTLAYFIRAWRTLTIVLGVLGAICIFLWWFVPESTRYLLVRGRYEETERILREVARVNKREYPDVQLVQYKEQRTGDFRDLFASKKMAHRTLVCWFSWFVNAMVYYCVILSSPGLGGDMYLNYTLTSIVEVPAYIACIWLTGRFGRKKSVVCGLIGASLASVGAVLCTDYHPTKGTDETDKGFLAGRIIMACLAKISVCISFNAIYIYSGELFPTVIRSVGMGSSTSTARFGSFASPYIANLNRVHALLPYAITGGFSLLAGALCMTLPETMNTPLEEVIESSEGTVELEKELGEQKRGEEEKAPLVDGYSSNGNTVHLSSC